jgi:hypothetical protein
LLLAVLSGMTRTILLIAAVGFTACVPTAATPGAPPPPAVDLQRSDTLDALPPWSYEGLRAGALAAIAPLMGYYGRDRPRAGTIQELRVLAWHVTVDTAEQLRVERALLWLHLSGDPPLWAVANLYRRPASDTTWRPATATHVQYFGARLSVTPPANADIHGLLDIAGNWAFDEDPAAPFVAADVRQRTWRAVVGEEPVRFYTRAGGAGAGAEDPDPAEENGSDGDVPEGDPTN